MSLTQKEKDFCRHYARLGNHREAAARAGYAFPDKAGAKLLGKQSIVEQIEQVREISSRIADAADGLRRIAFGSVTDAVRLMFCEDQIHDIESLDLFNVSEIKLSKNGGIEMKFFDRIKALEALTETAEAKESDSAPFIDAIFKGAAAINSAPRSEQDEL